MGGIHKAQRRGLIFAVTSRPWMSPNLSRKVTLSYLYKVHDERFYRSESLTLTSEDDVEWFESKYRERKLKVHFREISVLRPRRDVTTGELSPSRSSTGQKVLRLVSSPERKL
jgi:hypothetical protein